MEITSYLLLLMISFCLICETSHHLCMGCKDEEREALLNFKNSLQDEFNLLSSWTGKNCCRWRAVGCSNTTGHVTQLSFGIHLQNIMDCSFISSSRLDHSLSSLKYLQHLDLADFCFNRTSIPEFIGSLTSLKHLDLSNTDFSGTIPPQLGNLTNLHYLNLSYSLYLSAASLKWLSHLARLRYLDLTNVDLSKAVDWPIVFHKLPALSVLKLCGCGLNYNESGPHTNLSYITTLDLSDNDFSGSTALDRLLHNLSSSLVHLFLDYCGIWGDPIPHSIQNMFSLKTLVLSSNKLKGSIPESLGRLSQLEALDLSDNNLNGSIPESLGKLSQLETLDLSYNNLNGSILESLGRLSQLEALHLTHNNLNGSIPESLGRLSQLEALHLTNNNLNGSIPESLGRLSQLETLDLAWNSLQGSIPPSLFNLCSLHTLDLSFNGLAGDLSSTGDGQPWCMTYNLEGMDLSFNQLTGNLPDWIGQMRNLKVLRVYNNSLNGSVPESLGQLTKLIFLDLSYNSFQGVVSDRHFANMTELEDLRLLGNHLAFKLSSTWIPPFQLQYIQLGSCQLGPRFPSWLQTQRSIFSLDISDAGISDVVPIWFWKASSGADYVNISHNQIRGEIPKFLGFLRATVIDLSSNQLHGQLPRLNSRVRVILLDGNSFSGGIHPIINERMINLKVVLLSQNHLSGEIPSAICYLEALDVLDISFNNLSGQIPKCRTNQFLHLEVVNMASNFITGSIPQWIAVDTLKILHLENNSIQGEIPSFLRHCIGLHLLDLAENKLTGNIPSLIGDSLTELMFLRLSSNMLTGIIPPQLSHLTNLQVLDLAQNNLSGSIPHTFENLTSMAKLKRRLDEPLYDVWYYGEEEDMVNAIVKGREVVYTHTISLVMILDLSCNHFSGEIPMEIMKLVGLQTLNLSGNQLVGEIPDNFDGMVQLETLDLSRNHLAGAIPKSMASLRALDSLNLSYNNLSGQIPSGNQLRTLTDPSIYVGNRDLCGFPLPECHSDGNRNLCGFPLPECHSDELSMAPTPVAIAANIIHDSDEFYLSMGIGFAVGLWGICGIFIFSDSWRIAYFRFLDGMADKFFMAKLILRRWILLKLQGS